MTGPQFNPADEAMLVHLGRVAQAIDPAPSIVYEMGHAAFALRRLDAELAQLVADTAIETAGVRGAADQRLLTFEAGQLTLEVQVASSGERREILGQVVPPPGFTGGVVRLESFGGEALSAELDSVGGFRFDAVPQGLVRFHVELPDAAAVTTTWVSL